TPTPAAGQPVELGKEILFGGAGGAAPPEYRFDLPEDRLLWLDSPESAERPLTWSAPQGKTSLQVPGYLNGGEILYGSSALGWAQAGPHRLSLPATGGAYRFSVHSSAEAASLQPD
ncbi:hypothetical protein, partial [Parachitinimonas caeni]